jgi:Fungal chitosanase of glycosyl hydrolase group 75
VSLRRAFAIGTVAVAAAIVCDAVASTGARNDRGLLRVGGGRPPTAAQLLAKVKTCAEISNGRYAADEGGPRRIPICRVVGAVFWKADMDIDCDGMATKNCNRTRDPSFQDSTALEPGGRPLSAEATRYVVLPQRSAMFDYGKRNIALGAVAAVIYKGKVAYAVFGDTGPKAIVGEASYAVASALGINPDPATGGVASRVTYIVFKGTTVAAPRSNASIARAGEAAAARLAGGG